MKEDNVWIPALPSERLLTYPGIPNGDIERRVRRQTGIRSTHKTNQKQSPVDGYDVSTRRLLEVKKASSQTNMRFDKAGLDTSFLLELSEHVKRSHDIPEETLDALSHTGNLSITTLQKRCPEAASYIQDMFRDYAESYVSRLKETLPSSTWNVPSDDTWTWRLGLCFSVRGEQRLCIVEEDQLDHIEFMGIHKGRAHARLRRAR